MRPARESGPATIKRGADGPEPRQHDDVADHDQRQSATEKLVRLAQKVGLELRQSYRRVGKLALIKHQRYAHAHQFKRAGKALRKLKTYLGRTIRDNRQADRRRG